MTTNYTVSTLGGADLEDLLVSNVFFTNYQLWGWGANVDGQLGTNNTTSVSSPVQTVTTGTVWRTASAGALNTGAVKTDGTLWMWGSNVATQLGDNSGPTAPKSSPVQTVAGGTNWRQVSSGRNNHTVAVKTDGTLWLWGNNSSGQLGNGVDVTNRSSPIQTITGGNNWSQAIAGGQCTAAIKTDGTLWLWGNNSSGQLGDNTLTNKSSPVQTVAGGSNWAYVAGGNTNTAAIKTDGTLWVWGANASGQLGDNTQTTRSSPVQTVAGGSNWSQVAVGDSHMAAIKTDGTLWLWGLNTSGQLGDNTLTNKSSPVQTVAGGSNWVYVACGQTHTAAIKTDGTLWLWGSGTSGQLGDNTAATKSSPVQTVAGGTTWRRVWCGGNFTVAIKT